MSKSFFILATLPILLLAVEPVDLEMSSQDKKQTGLFKLSEKEKAFFQKWLDSNYEKRATPLAAPAPKAQKPTLLETLNGGSYIRLTDGSLWNIRPQDTPITVSWITPVEIIVTPSKDPKYPFTLTNSLTGSAVLAKKATEVPSSRRPSEPQSIPAPSSSKSP